MPYAVVSLPFKPHRLDGLSERLLVSHYENNYGGAVRRLNAIEQRATATDWTSAAVFEINGLSRERLMAANSMILHEIYFDGLGGSGEPAGDIAAALERDFGSVDRWRSEFITMGKALAGGSGWVLLTWSPRLGRLTNQWAADHTHALVDGSPILALDMYEHAYHLDFGANAAAYVDAHMRNIHWERVASRYARAIEPRALADPEMSPQVTVEDLRDRLTRGESLVLLDVRLADDLARATDRIANAAWRNPEKVTDWAKDLKPDKPIIVYCMYGFWVSQDCATALRNQGLDARSLHGGIAAWRAIGGYTVPLEQSRQTGAAA